MPLCPAPSLLNGIHAGYIVHDPAGATVPFRDQLAEVYEWLPGNLYIGPDGVWRSDDPGGAFETKAGAVVGRSFSTWTNANSKVTDYLSGAAANPIPGLTSLSTIARRTSVFGLNPNRWDFNATTNKFAVIIPPQLELQSRPQESIAAE
jgi:hypothetical protein